MPMRLLQRLMIGLALTFAPIAEAAPPSGIHSIQDLFDTCDDPAATSKVACETYVHAAIQTSELVHAADNGGKLTPLFCPNDQLGAADLISVLRTQVAAHPERRSFPAPTVIVGGAVEAYPCPHPTATPSHRAKPRSRRR